MVRQYKNQVIAHVKKTGAWDGYIVGSKVNTYHIRNGWHLGFEISLYWHETRGVCVKDHEVCELQDNGRYEHVPMTLADFITDWQYYNANYELGYYPAFYRV